MDISLIHNLNLAGVLKEIFNIPKWLLCLVLLTMSLGLVYLIYSKTCSDVSPEELEEIKTEIIELNKKSNNDAVFTSQIALLYNLIEYTKDMNIAELDILIEHVKTTYPEDKALLSSIEMLKQNYEKTCAIYKKNYENISSSSILIENDNK